MNAHSQYERYSRQTLLKGFGESGQQKLFHAKVLVIGAGGLGCPALQYLAGAGIGTIGIVDDDIVSLSNLHRQVLYATNDIGLPKAECAAHFLQQLNPEITILSYKEKLTVDNAFRLINMFDIVLDGTDNFAAKYLINDACVLLQKPFVYGAVSKFEGQVAVFNYQNTDGERSANYRDIFPVPPKDDEVLNCEEAGVLGVLPGITGTMQANETIKLIAGIGKPLINKLLTYNLLTNEIYELALSAKKETAFLIPKDENAFMQTDYVQLCAAKNNALEIDADKFDQLITSNNTLVIDVREDAQSIAVTAFQNIRIPLSKLEENISMPDKNTIITVCNSGNSSLKAAQYLADIFGDKKNIFSLKGGISNWIKKQEATHHD
jgi:adenylyltransferase/sulfurtransferase